MLASTKYSRWQNSHVDKILASTKYSHRQNTRVDKILAWTKCWRRCRSISLLFGPAESTAADFSQTSLMFSHVSQQMLIPPHAVAKCAVATGGPTFIGGLSPALYWLIVLARHAEKILASTKYWRSARFHWFLPNYSSQYLCSQVYYKKLVGQKVITITVQYQFTYS
jgi:hypothetical protein